MTPPISDLATCPSCASPDVVSYWQGAADSYPGAIHAIFRATYPDARRCVDCGHVWWREPRPLDLARIGKAAP